uniref:RNA polymerase i specific transcription initiation factor n=1 Tax=Colletotrichum fructicola (strain Nara gc5) TaxID=1213859 RepID=L2FXH2_COLFN
MTANEEQWDLDTDEIRSIDSEELYETRPNRWKGSKATWHVYTQEERLIYRSLEEVRNRDLSVHLYNAFALKNRETRAGAAEPMQSVDASDWRPPNPWTAWPMNTQTVPGDDFLKQTHDEDDEFTIRSNAPQMPSTALEDELTATILRQAKERFYQRQEKYRRKEAAAQHRRNVAIGGYDRTKTYEAVVSANDDLSADLLCPSVRHILTVMDNTLTTLHNARLAGLSYMTDSSASATDLSDAEGSDSASGPEPRTPEPERSASGKRGKGRPRKVQTPLPGETEREMVIRIARAQKKKIPAASDAEDNNANMDNIAAIHENDADDEDMSPEKHRPIPKSPARSPRKKRDLPPEARMEARTKAREAMLGNWGLRDWSDVLGAASISGFKPEVVARAAQRAGV